MQKIKLFLLVLGFILAVSVLTTKVLAGGGPLFIDAFPLRPFDTTKTFILEADVYTNENCNQVKPDFAFKDSTPGDSIAPFVLSNDGTFMTRHYDTGQPDFTWKEICTTYAQVKSSVAKQRTVTVSVVVDGKKETREMPVAFGDDQFSRELQSFGRVNDYENTPAPDVISEKYLGNDKRLVNLHWQKIGWAVKYMLLGWVVKSDGTLQSPFEITTTKDISTSVTVNASSYVAIDVIACRSESSCNENGDNKYGRLILSRRLIPGWSQPGEGIPEITPNAIPVVTIIAPTSADEKRIEDLNQKVTNLENQLEQSNKRQSLLEARLEQILGILRSIFPFLK